RPNEESGLHAKGLGPQQIPVGRYPAASRFELRDEGVIFGSHALGQLALRKPAGFPQLLKPAARLPSQLHHLRGRQLLGIRVHARANRTSYSKPITPTPSRRNGKILAQPFPPRVGAWCGRAHSAAAFQGWLETTEGDAHPIWRIREREI